ncbi:hypothetical protein C8R42DRAFT_739374 [Lentinula raphanica]|nr:hypothetical protein C8R42DRAFT_739374 [Lentinula raphanica]
MGFCESKFNPAFKIIVILKILKILILHIGLKEVITESNLQLKEDAAWEFLSVAHARDYTGQKPRHGSHKMALLVKCQDSQTDQNEVLLTWDHIGDHPHPHPPGGRLTVGQKAEVQMQVYRSQDASPHKLRAGDIGPGSIPLPHIAPKLASARAARYEVNQAKANLGVTTSSALSKSSAGALHSWKELEAKLDEKFLIDSWLHGSVIYVVMQTAFMRQMLEESVDMWFQNYNKDDTEWGRHGCVTDGDHTFFRFANLLATYHAGSHFEEKMLIHVMDFSGAQILAHSLNLIQLRDLDTIIIQLNRH